MKSLGGKPLVKNTKAGLGLSKLQTPQANFKGFFGFSGLSLSAQGILSYLSSAKIIRVLKAVLLYLNRLLYEIKIFLLEFAFLLFLAFSSVKNIFFYIKTKIFVILKFLLLFLNNRNKLYLFLFLDVLQSNFIFLYLMYFFLLFGLCMALNLFSMFNFLFLNVLWISGGYLGFYKYFYFY